MSKQGPSLETPPPSRPSTICSSQTKTSLDPSPRGRSDSHIPLGPLPFGSLPKVIKTHTWCVYTQRTRPVDALSGFHGIFSVTFDLTSTLVTPTYRNTSFTGPILCLNELCFISPFILVNSFLFVNYRWDSTESITLIISELLSIKLIRGNPFVQSLLISLSSTISSLSFVCYFFLGLHQNLDFLYEL